VDDAATELDLAVAGELLAGPAGVDLLTVAAREAGVELVTAQLRSVHHRAGRSLSHVFAAELRVQGQPREVLLVAHVDRKGFPDGTFHVALDGVPVAVWRFPHDPYLPGLPSAIDAGRVRELLDGLDGPAGDVRLHTRAYRPSRRAVVEVAVDGPQEGRVLYLKVLAGDRAVELAELHRQLLDHVPVPSVIGVDAGLGLVAFPALPGRTLRSALLAGAALPDPDELVALSTRFAASALDSRRDPRAFADPSRHVAGLLRLVPDREAEIVEAARSAAAAADGPVVPVHGDLHDGQLLLDDAGHVTGLLDVDGAGLGSLAQDAGSLVAHLAAIGEVWPEVRDRSEPYADAVADAYRPVVGDTRLRAAVAGAWLGLATGPHRAQEPGWPEATRRRIDRAVAALRA
jgi:hypothetical protein